MTIYVDDMRMPAKVKGCARPARWSHLMAGPADDIADLHAFAAKLRLRRSWFQEQGWPHDHYDVTDTVRRAAIKAGAVPVTSREMALMCMAVVKADPERRRAAVQAHPPPWLQAARAAKQAREGGTP
jgi:Protein of unknown function (DUF4031)